MKPWIQWIIRIPLILLGLVASLVLVAAVAFLILDRTNGTIVSSGVKRPYLLYVPKSYDPATTTPLVISIHGFAEWPAHQMQMTHWNDLADQYGFIVVYPSGTRFPKRWRTQVQAGSDASPDVTFISDLIDKLESEYNIDPGRIYANGLSNGGAGCRFFCPANFPAALGPSGPWQGLTLSRGASVLPPAWCRPLCSTAR